VLDRLLDCVRPAVERLLDARERQLPQDQERDPERDQRPDHQPDAGRDEEVPRVLRRECDYGQHQPERKKAIRPKMKA
jgi:hypothetical protein